MTGAWDGVPENPERDGWHWVQRNDGKYTAMLWVAQRQWYESPHYDGDVLRPSRVANPRANWTYHGPCLTPADVEARERAAWQRACEAMKDLHAGVLVAIQSKSPRWGSPTEHAEMLRALPTPEFKP